MYSSKAFLLVCAAALLLVGCSSENTTADNAIQTRRDEIAFERENLEAAIALIKKDKRRTEEALYAVLAKHGIPSGIEGTVVHWIMVQNKDAERAREVLQNSEDLVGIEFELLGQE